jgi:glutamyl-tRNA reductase
MRIVVHGLNHRTAPLDLRERVALLPDEAEDVLDRLRRHDGILEVAVLSTCNRTEFYAISQEPESVVAMQRDLIRTIKSIDLDEGNTYVHVGRPCVEHLFRVAGGVDSMVLGEPGILGQVKAAYETALRHEAAGTVFGRLFPSALRVGKRSRTETGIARGAVSMSKAGIQLADKIFGDLSRRSALVVGAGEIGEQTGVLLRESGIAKLTIANRSAERAARVAERTGGRATTLDDLSTEIARTNVVVTAVNAPQPIVTQEIARRAMEHRREGPLLIVDLGVPRNVAPDVGRIENVFLYAVDDLQELVNLNLGRRRKHLPAVESIVREETDRFVEWIISLDVTPVVVELRAEAERIRKETVARFDRNLSSSERELLERFSTTFLNRMMHHPTVTVRGCDPKSPEDRRRIDWTRRLFGMNGTDHGANDVPEDDS